MSQLVYPEPVSAVIHRMEDGAGNYYFVRNQTKIIFGSGKDLIGAVVMTNPGSFDFKHDKDWSAFFTGQTIYDRFESDKGRPDPAMQNIIQVIRVAYLKAKKPIPEGYVSIYNISSVKCPKGKEAAKYHEKVEKVMQKNNMNLALLKDLVVHDKVEFINTCNNSLFIIIGFLKDVFLNETNNILNWIGTITVPKIVQAKKGTNWPYHPIMWKKWPELGQEAINNLYNVIK